MRTKVWNFSLVWTWAFCLFSAYGIITEKNPVWAHVVCGVVQLVAFAKFVVIVKLEAPNAN